MAHTKINTQVIPDGTIVSADLTMPITGFSSTGIDDNATSTALTIDSSGNIAVTGTVDGIDIAARDAVLTSTTTTAGAALPKAGGTMTGTLAMGANAITSTGTISSGDITVIDPVSNNFNGKILIGGAGSNRRLILEQNDYLTYRMGGTGGLSITQLVSGGSTGVGNVGLTLDSSGNVGIGTSSVQEKLHVYNAGLARIEVEGTTSLAAFKATNNQGSYAWYVDASADKFHLFDFTDSADRMTIDGSGNLGIGETNPSAKLSVNNGGSGNLLSLTGSLGTIASNKYGNTISFSRPGSNYISASGSGANLSMSALDFLRFQTNSTERMRIDADGNVGIGTSDPDAPLDVVGYAQVVRNTGTTNSGDQTSIVAGAKTTGASNTSFGAGLQFQVENSSGAYAGSRIVSRLNADNNTADLVFQSRNYGFSDSMAINASGNVGYSGKLFSSNNTATLSGLQLYRDHATGSCYLFDSTTAPYSGPLIFGTNNTERMRIDANGTLIHKAAAVFNEDGGNSDFRVESDGNTHALFVDASENLVTVGSSGGYGTLQVVGDNAPSEYRTLFVTSASDITKGVAIAYDNTNDVGVITAVDAGTGWKALRIANTAMTIDRGLSVNDSSNSAGDFRVESDGNTHMLYVDSSFNRVGIGTTSPQRDLHVDGPALIESLTPVFRGSHTSGSNGYYWKIGSIELGSSASAEITVYGTDSYSAGQPVAGKSTLIMRGSNSTTTLETLFYSESSGAQPVRDARYVNTGNNTYDIYIALGTFAGLEQVIVTGGVWAPLLVNTSSVTPPSGSVQFNQTRRIYSGSFVNPTLVLSGSEVAFNENGIDTNFRVESDSNANMLAVDAGLDSVVINGATAYKGSSLNVQGIYRNIATSAQYSNAAPRGQQVCIAIGNPGATTTSVWGSTAWSWVTAEVQVYIATSGAGYKKTYSGIIFRNTSEVVNIVNESSAFQLTTGTPSAGKFGIGFRESNAGVGPTYNGSPIKTDFVVHNNTGQNLYTVSVTIKVLGSS